MPKDAAVRDAPVERAYEIEERGDATTLTIASHSRARAHLGVAIGAPLLVVPIIVTIVVLVAYGLLAALIPAAVTFFLGRALFRWVERKHETALVFDAEGVAHAARRLRYRYEDVTQYGVAHQDDGVEVPLNSPRAAAMKIGWMLYVDHGSKRTPLVTGLDATAAREVFKAFEELMRRYAGG